MFGRRPKNDNASILLASEALSARVQVDASRIEREQAAFYDWFERKLLPAINEALKAVAQGKHPRYWESNKYDLVIVRKDEVRLGIEVEALRSDIGAALEQRYRAAGYTVRTTARPVNEALTMYTTYVTLC
jgi:hypothetical protein